MTYNVFGGTLSLTQSAILETSYDAPPSQTQSLYTLETLALPNILNTITVLSIFGFTSDIEHVTIPGVMSQRL